MHIAYDHQIFEMYPYGGIARYFFELANGIAVSGDHKATIVCPLYVSEYLGCRDPALTVIGVRVPALPKTGRLRHAINDSLVKPLIARTGAKIVHETYYSKERIAPKNSLVLLTVYDMIHEKFPEYLRKNDSTRRDKASAVKRADHVICISEHTRRDLLNMTDTDPAKTSVVHLGFSPMPLSDINSPQQFCQSPYLLYVGNRSGYKNFDNFLRGFARSSWLRHETKVVCFGGGKFSEAERSVMSSCNLNGSQVIHMAGDDKTLASLYRRATAFVYPSLYEGFGLPPLEAMSLDCPVVCSNSSSIPEVVGNAARMFDPTDLCDIMEALESVVSDESTRIALVERGRAHVKQFSWKSCVDQTISICEQKLQA